MFKKPLCPYCRAIYDVKDIKNQVHNQRVTCHNCKKTFVVKKQGGFALVMMIAVIVAIVFNLFLITVINVKSIVTMFVSAVIFIVLALLLKPFFVKYVKEKK